jgi:lipopolysaccharide export LptBFGC system permease protein LptF
VSLGCPFLNGKIRHTQDEEQQNTNTQYNTENNQEWTTQRHWQNQAHKTQDEDQQNTKTQYNTENNQEWTTQRHWQNQAHTGRRTAKHKAQYNTENNQECTTILDCFLCCIVFLCFSCPVSCVPDFASVSWLSILDCSIGCIVFLCFACLRPVCA